MSDTTIDYMLIFGISYLAVGALLGLIFEERYYQMSSESSREPGNYIFSACAMAIMWPSVLIFGGRS